MNETARLFNSAIAAPVISAAFELGILEEIRQRCTITADQFCRDNGLHPESVAAILRVLSCFDVVAFERKDDPNVAIPGANFSDVYQGKGYFLWLVRGYGYMLQNLQTFARNENRVSPLDFRRAGDSIAKAGRDYGAQFVDEPFEQTLQEIPFQIAADLGCGSGARLIKLALADERFRGVGVDINPDAVKFAQSAVETAGLQHRVQVSQGNVMNLAPRPEFAKVDVLFCFFMGHDLWPRENCLQALRCLRTVFPEVKRFLLCDTYRSESPASPHVPIFTLGFEFTHSIMNQKIPNVAEWLDLFPEAGWECAGQRDIGIPFSTIFDLRPVKC